MVPGRSLVLAAFIAFAGPLDLLTRFAGRSSLIKLANVLENHSELTPAAPEACLMFPMFGVERRADLFVNFVPERA